MHVTGIILAVLGWILLGLLALLLIVLIIPVCVSMELREGTLSVRGRLLGVFTIQLLPLRQKEAPKRGPEKKAKPAAPGAEKPPAAPPAPPAAETAEARDTPAPEPKEQPAGEPAAEQEKKKLRITFDFVMEMLSAAGVLMRRVFRALHFRKIILVLPIHGKDAAQTALTCGRVQAALSAGIAALENFLDLRFDGVRILPDYTGDIKAGPYVFLELRTRPIMLLLAGLCALWRFLMRWLNDRKLRAKAGKDIQKMEEKQ